MALMLSNSASFSPIFTHSHLGLSFLYQRPKSLRSKSIKISHRSKLSATFADQSSSDDKLQAPVSQTSEDDLAAKLAAAEAEAAALRRELAAREGDKNIDLAKLTPAKPEKRVDGVGYRETLFSAPGRILDEDNVGPRKWGLSEAELFLSKGMHTESNRERDALADGHAKELVKRRLLIGTALTLSAVTLAFFKLPIGLLKPSKPLFLYIIPILHLKEQLENLENTASDANSVRLQLRSILDSGEVNKETFLSAASYLGADEADIASSLTYTIFDYLNQADYNKYFDYIGQPSSSQELSFLKFSLQSVQAARENIEKFLTLLPKDDLEAAMSRLMS